MIIYRVNKMKEISLNILDIAMNSVRADSQNISVFIDETQETIAFSVIDDGCGMSKELLSKVSDPFCTTRTTRRVGMGIPFLKLTAEQTGGYIEINSKPKDEFPNNHGTRISALFYKNHIDCLPLGDIISTVITLIQGAPQIDFEFKHRFDCEKEIVLSTKEIKNILGDVSVDTPDVLVWIRDFLTEQYDQCKKN